MVSMSSRFVLCTSPSLGFQNQVLPKGRNSEQWFCFYFVQVLMFGDCPILINVRLGQHMIRLEVGVNDSNQLVYTLLVIMSLFSIPFIILKYVHFSWINKISPFCSCIQKNGGSFFISINVTFKTLRRCKMSS